jgi:acyl-CoA dehydrogenase
VSDEAKLLGEAARGILGRRLDPDAPWAAIDEGGWIGIGIDEEVGGLGGSLVEAVAVAEAAGATAAGAPVVECMLAGLVLGVCEATRPLLADVIDGRERAALVPRVVRSDRSGFVADLELVVPWGGDATLVVLIAALDDGGPGLAVVPIGDVEVTRGQTLAGDPLDRLKLPGVQLPGRMHDLEVPLDELISGAALLSAARLCGALRRVAGLSTEYARQRAQFGRSIGSFQAVAHDLVRQEGHVALAEAALRMATGRAGGGRAEAARVVASSAVDPVVKIAHQVHGAVGVTREHDLHRYALRLAEWRGDFGSRRWWMRRLGRRALASGAWWDDLRPEVAGPVPAGY